MKFKFSGHIFNLAETLKTEAPDELAAQVECALLQFEHPNWAGDGQDALAHHLKQTLGDVEILEMDKEEIPKDAII